MSYKIDLLDRTTLAKIKEIEIVNEPKINEEINGSFTFSFNAHYSAKNDLTNNVIISVDNKYFKIAKVTKSRDDSITLTVYCEHISYELIIDFELTDDMEFESDAAMMINQFLEGTRFTLISCIATDAKYYTTKTLDIRKRLFEVANLFGGELIFDNFNVSLVQQRGSDKGLDVELGVNLLGVTEEKNFVDGKTSYELDLVDLSQVSGYELDFSAAEIGDTITIKDNVLGIDTNERIIAIEYNPFKKALPTVTVGDYIPDLTEYFKDDDEEEKEDDDPRANYFLESFKIGAVDCLELSGVEVDNDDVLPGGISASLDFSEYEKLKGVQVSLKSQYSSYHVTIYKVLQEGDYDTFNYATSATEINNWMLPTENIAGIGVLVTAVPLSEFDANVHKFAQYGVNFYRAQIDVFREVRVGKVNALDLGDVELFPPLNLPDDIIAEVPFEEGETLTGLFVSLKQDYKSWYVKVTTYNESGAPTDYNLADIAATAKTWTMPSASIEAITLTAMEKPPAQFVEGTHRKQMIGFTFFSTIPDDEETEYLASFKIGDVDMLSVAGDETMQVIDYVKGSITEVIASTTYTTKEVLKGAFAQLKEAYSDYHLTVLDYRQTGEQKAFQVVNYSSALASWNYPNSETGIRSIVLVVTKKPFASLNAGNIDDNVLTASGVKVEFGEFEGLITIKSKDEDGKIISTIEQTYTETGTYEIEADEIDGYELISESSVSVELTVEESEKIIEFVYRDVGGGTSQTGYTLEFGTTQLSSVINFYFEREYDSIESITTGIIGTNTYRVVTADKIMEGDKYIGVRVTTTGTLSGAQVSIQAVCYRGMV